MNLNDPLISGHDFIQIAEWVIGGFLGLIGASAIGLRIVFRMESKLDKSLDGIKEHDKRILKIEENYVRHCDLDNVKELLRRDIDIAKLKECRS